MLEYFTYKKVKKHRTEKADCERLEDDRQRVKDEAVASGHRQPTAAPLLNEDDQTFLQRIIAEQSDDVGSRPPLPPRVKTPSIYLDSDEDDRSVKGKAQTKSKSKTKSQTSKSAEPKKEGFVGGLGRRVSVLLTSRNKKELHPSNNTSLAVTEPEVDQERNDLATVLDDLNLSAQNNRAFSLSAESNEMVQKFVLVLKDVVAGAPTAYDDLAKLLDDRDGTLARNYEKLPKSLQKLVTQLPTKLTGSLAPELLAVAAEAQGLGKDKAPDTLKGAAKKMLTPSSLQQLITKPGAIVGMLKGIMNALKLRWPAFIGTNVLWSVALFLLMFVLWYCHKRGRETRLERERSGNVIDGSSRIEELPDDLALPPPSGGSSRNRSRENVRRHRSTRSTGNDRD